MKDADVLRESLRVQMNVRLKFSVSAVVGFGPEELLVQRQQQLPAVSH